MVNREKANYFRYLAAQPTSARTNSSPTTAGEWLRIQREKLQVMWNAIDMVDNSGLCSGILIKFPTYVCGTLTWQAKTGNKNVNQQYQQYIREKTTKPGNIDIGGRFSLRQQCMLDIKSIALKGDVGTNIVTEDDDIYLQGIEANRIGDPYKYLTNSRYVRGLRLDPKTGRIISAMVYYQDKSSGFYRFDDEYPMRDPETGLPKFLFFANPISYDDYRGVSLFKTAIDNDTYISRMREYELQALLWAASQSGVYYTKSGGLPESLPFNRNRLQDRDGNYIDTYETRPNTLIGLSSEGEKVEMFQHDRPSPNVIGMYENTVLDICNGAGITLQFGYNMTGLTGPGVRMASAQDARAIQIWQEMLREQKLDQVIMVILGNAIAKGELPYHPKWQQWDWFFPAKPTIDVGRESEANIEEVGATMNTRAKVVADAGLGDVTDVITQGAHETEEMIEAAMEVGKRLNVPWEQVYAFMNPPPRGRGSTMQAALNAGQQVKDNTNRDQAGATDEGVDLNDEGGNGNGEGNNFALTNGSKKNDHQSLSISTDQGDIEIFYNPDQLRDQGGKFADEGKGAGEPGYEHPDVVGLKGLDKRLVDVHPHHRPLSREAKDVVSVRKHIPGIHYVMYSKTPFFDQLNKLQGTPDPEIIGIKEYTDARHKLFKDQPVGTLPIKGLIATQPVVNKTKVKRNIKEDNIKKIYVVHYGDKYFVMDGHHALAAAAKRGDKEIEAHVLEMPDKETKLSQQFDAESGKSQQRDQTGKWTDEGKGSLEPGYVHPSEGGNGQLIKKAHEPPSPSAEMYSPNTAEMDFAGAIKAMHGDGQHQARSITDDIDKQLGIKGASYDGIGDWSDGAENSVVHEMSNVNDWDELRYSAAIKGKALNQKAVLAFKADDKGKDAIHAVTLPSSNLKDIRDRLDTAGITHRTLLPDGSVTHIIIYDQDNKLSNNLALVAKQYGDIKDKWEGINVSSVRGTGEFVGESDTREGAAKNYDSIIQGYEKQYPNRGHYRQIQWQGVHDNRNKIDPPKDDSDTSRYVADLKQTPEYKSLQDRTDKLASDPVLKDYSKAIGRATSLEDWSLAKNALATGQLTPERQELHEKIISGLMNPNAVTPEGERPKAVLLMGRPGAGKTTAGGERVKQLGEFTKLNPDDIRAELPENEGWNAPATQAESKEIYYEAISKAVSNHHNILMDETGSNKDKMSARAELLTKNGYDVHVVYVDAPQHEAIHRTWERYLKGEASNGKIVHRFVDPGFQLNGVDGKPEATYNELSRNPNVKSAVKITNRNK
jgi:adenylate kinase family enzyme